MARVVPAGRLPTRSLRQTHTTHSPHSPTRSGKMLNPRSPLSGGCSEQLHDYTCTQSSALLAVPTIASTCISAWVEDTRAISTKYWQHLYSPLPYAPPADSCTYRARNERVRQEAPRSTLHIPAILSTDFVESVCQLAQGTDLDCLHELCKDILSANGCPLDPL